MPTAPHAEGALNRLVSGSIQHRGLVIALSALGVLLGLRVGASLPVDVFPDLTAPTVTVVTEAHGLAPEEVELLVTAPLEAALNGAAGVRRLRSASGVGLSVVYAEFDWGADLPRARQVVAERLSVVGPSLPPDLAPPQITPTSSVMGEIMFLALRWDAADASGPARARGFADHVLRKQLLGVPGVSQVVPIGGAQRQLQVQLEPAALAGFGLSVDAVGAALKGASGEASGGFLADRDQEWLVRARGRARSPADWIRVGVPRASGPPVPVAALGAMVEGARPARGAGGAMGEPAVVLSVQKQPEANTLALTAQIDAVVADLGKQLPTGVSFSTATFRQADFIAAAIGNVGAALRDGALLVCLILALFLANGRAALISLAAIPTSLVAAVLALAGLGLGLDTMTLGGLTIAIGSVVDDAIIDVENVIRRMREDAALPPEEQRGPLRVIFSASVEIRGSIIFATLIIVLVFLPLFFLDGVEGRMLAPLGLAYVVAIVASLLVAMTLTPALCAALLPGRVGAGAAAEGRAARWASDRYAPLLEAALQRPQRVLGLSLGAALAAGLSLPFLGRSFLPPFNEGALTINVVTAPGTALRASDALGQRVETALLHTEGVRATTRRTGRAELDEHAQDVNASELELVLDPAAHDGEAAATIAGVREALGGVSGAAITVGQPLSHRIDHLLSGTRAAIAVKVFGDDLDQLRGVAEQVKAVAETVPGAVDVSVEQQVEIPTVDLRPDREALAAWGLGPAALGEAVERALLGHRVGFHLDGQRPIEVVVKLHDPLGPGLDGDRSALASLPIDTPLGVPAPLGALASLQRSASPNTIAREGGVRKVVVQANVAGRSLSAVVEELQARVEAEVVRPEGVRLSYGGQFESAAAAARTISLVGAGVLLAVGLLLRTAFGSTRNALVMLVNLPLSLIGGVAALALTGAPLSTPALVGFVTLFGVATRNGILMVSHYDHLMRVEGLDLAAAVRRGSAERLLPVLMTALSAGLALVPLVLAADAPGNELQAPMGVVMLGGLLSSTTLNMFVVPVLFLRHGEGGRG
ncbi:MAG: efflux RND transporter permease subunit [Deltaproteobacteria bacterium]|nr:efflux RND transporter permease subunit [Deltaproteobacteria bacterium]